MISKMREKLSDPEYRRAFVASQINIGIPFQVRALLKSRPDWTQETLANRTGMLQPRISGLMTPGKTRPNIETLRRIAEAFDCGLMVRFVPFSELARWSDSFDPEVFYVPGFNDDAGFEEKGTEESFKFGRLTSIAHGADQMGSPTQKLREQPLPLPRMENNSLGSLLQSSGQQDPAQRRPPQFAIETAVAA